MAILSQYCKAAALSIMMVSAVGATLSSSAMATNYNSNQAIYRDGNFHTLAQKLRKDLNRSGYQVMDIQAINQRGTPAVVVFAKKNNLPYELKYTYPGLKLISSSQKQWSTVWQDKKKYHSGNYQNVNHKQNYYGNDIEDNIKKEARYPAIKKSAIRKVTSMGYQVKDIDIDEKNNRGVFEIEAKKGGQDYDIILGYPNLNVIKIEKD
ncbi:MULTISPECIES: hypothetical protein [Psychrobacter]|uniref:hypothetical protein n=1 Tax=Psychrobacter TaxID=497 RepID=UPI00146DF305|nr:MULTISPECIES: hypothetical protein [Psychrobacter]